MGEQLAQKLLCPVLQTLVASAQVEHKAVGAARASLRSKLNEGEMGSLALGRSLRQPSSTHVANGGCRTKRSQAALNMHGSRLDLSEGQQRDRTSAFEVMGLFTDGATFTSAAGIIGVVWAKLEEQAGSLKGKLKWLRHDCVAVLHRPLLRS